MKIFWADAEDNPTIADHKGQGSTGGSDDRSSKSSSPVGAEGGDEEEDDMADGNESGESKPINEDWDSGRCFCCCWCGCY